MRNKRWALSTITSRKNRGDDRTVANCEVVQMMIINIKGFGLCVADGARIELCSPEDVSKS